jgi:hypothetical protein
VSVDLVNGQGWGVCDVVGLSDPFSSFPIERELFSIFHPGRRADRRPGLFSALFSLDTKARKKIKRRTPLPPEPHIKIPLHCVLHQINVSGQGKGRGNIEEKPGRANGRKLTLIPLFKSIWWSHLFSTVSSLTALFQ